LISNPYTLHRLSQILRLGKPTSVLKIIPLKENHGLVGILGVAKQITSLTSTLPTSGAVLIEARLPPLVVLDFVAD
jgi:hypothetical protein